MSAENESKEFTFDTASAGTSPSLSIPSVRPPQRRLRRPKQDSPCKIVDLSVSKLSKHSNAKVNIIAIDIFTSKKYDHVTPSHNTVGVPIVHKQEYLLLDIANDGFISLSHVETGETKDDVKVPIGDVGEKLTKLFGEEKEIQVIVQAATGDEAIIEVEEVQEGWLGHTQTNASCGTR
jgi:translation initiation factor 5A